MESFHWLIALGSALFLTLFNAAESQVQRHVRVTSIRDPPYLMLRENAVNLTGNERFEGFAVDLAKILAQKLNFNYTIKLVQDERFGTMSREGEWNGMIRELVYSMADIAIAPLTMTAERAEVVDFTRPFMEFQLRIAMKKDDKVMDAGVGDPGSYVFLRPFSGVLWAVTVVCTVILVLLLYTIEIFVPRKFEDPIKSTVPLRVKFCPNGICGSPRTISGRMLQIVFWIFVVAIIAAYIAAFTGDRIVDRLGSTEEAGMAVKSPEDLTAQTQIKYGVRRGGSTYAFFHASVDRLYRKMYTTMVRESGFVESAEEGYERVRNDSSYAFIAESPNAEYMVTRPPCDIVASPTQFGPRKAFALAVRKSDLDSNLKKLKDGINLEILRMRESGQLETLRSLWFADSSACGNREIEVTEMGDALCLYNMAGVFYFLITAIIVALIIAAVEVNKKGPKVQRNPAAVELRVPLHPARDARNAAPTRTGNSN